VTTALLLSALMVLPAQADDPEPPAKKGIVARLVARKVTYKLDFGGIKKDDYVTAAKNGTATPVPVELEFVITNHTKGDVRIRVAGSTARMALELTGAGAVESAAVNAAARPKLTYQILKPGQKYSIPITTLTSLPQAKGKVRSAQNHYWTEPGEYRLGAALTTLVYQDYGTNAMKSQTMTLTAKAITLKVEK
jgi:hypothetical protein